MKSNVNGFRIGKCRDVCNVSTNVWYNKLPARRNRVIYGVIMLITETFECGDNYIII